MDASGVKPLTVRKSRHPVHFEERLKLVVNSWRAGSASNGFGNSSRNPSNARRTLARPFSFTNCSKTPHMHQNSANKASFLKPPIPLCVRKGKFIPGVVPFSDG